jgi:hypothetical protein
VRKLLSERWFRLSAGLIFSLLVVVLACAWYFRIWSWHDLVVYTMMSRECPPVWQDLQWGRVHAGQDVEEVIATTKPVRVERYGEFIRLDYQDGLSFTGITVMAKNGRPASACAWSCTWDRVFFDRLTQEDQKAFSDAYEAHWGPIRQKKREEAEQAGAAGRPPE